LISRLIIASAAVSTFSGLVAVPVAAPEGFGADPAADRVGTTAEAAVGARTVLLYVAGIATAAPRNVAGIAALAGGSVGIAAAEAIVAADAAVAAGAAGGTGATASGITGRALPAVGAGLSVPAAVPWRRLTGGAPGAGPAARARRTD